MSLLHPIITFDVANWGEFDSTGGIEGVVSQVTAAAKQGPYGLRGVVASGNLGYAITHSWTAVNEIYYGFWFRLRDYVISAGTNYVHLIRSQGATQAMPCVLCYAVDSLPWRMQIVDTLGGTASGAIPANQWLWIRAGVKLAADGAGWRRVWVDAAMTQATGLSNSPAILPTSELIGVAAASAVANLSFDLDTVKIGTTLDDVARPAMSRRMMMGIG